MDLNIKTLLGNIKMALSTIHVSSSSEIKYDSQGVLISNTSSSVFLSKANISSITNNTSSLSIFFHSNPTIFTITSSQNYLITNICNNLSFNSTSNNNQSDSDSDSYID